MSDATLARRPSRWRPATVVVPACAAALAFLWVFASVLSPRLSWAQVAQAVDQQSWIHFVYPEKGAGRPAGETWFSRRHGILAVKTSAALIFNDRAKDVTLTCDPRPRLVRQHIDRQSPMDESARASFVLGPLFDAVLSGDASAAIDAGHGVRFIPQTIREVGRDGRTLLEFRFETTFTAEADRAGRRSQPLQLAIEVDPETRLPERCALWRRESDVWKLRTEAAIDFPDDGPRDIYALGAPRTAEIGETTQPDR